MKLKYAWLVAGLLGWATAATAAGSTVLVYTRNGPTADGKKGFVHDNIASSVKALEELGAANGFGVEVTNEASIFTRVPLQKYKAIIFANSNNSAFDTEAQKKAFQDYIHGGGGFVGIHSATGSERAWPWFWQLAGGTFAWHAKLQKFPIQVVDRAHPSTSFLPPGDWPWEDEFYVMKEQPKDLHVLLAGDIRPLAGLDKKKIESLPASIPLAWCHEFEGGRAFYTALGHKIEYYNDELFRKHLLGGILWAMGGK